MTYLMCQTKSSAAIEVERFFQSVTDNPFVGGIAKSSVTEARSKLKPGAFQALNRTIINTFESNVECHKWRNFRLLAIDGTTFRLPETPEIIEHFGTHGGGTGRDCPMARFSQLFDPLNKLTIASFLSTPRQFGEREHAHHLLLDLMPDDLVLLDRGYPAFWLFKAITDIGGQFCARMPIQWRVVRDFVDINPAI